METPFNEKDNQNPSRNTEGLTTIEIIVNKKYIDEEESRVEFSELQAHSILQRIKQCKIMIWSELYGNIKRIYGNDIFVTNNWTT